MSKWVCHISGQGRKFEIDEVASGHDYWYAKLEGGSRYDLPKSEYEACDPPEEWEDVTKEYDVKFVNNDRLRIMRGGANVIRQAQDFRLRKIQLREEISYQGQWAFIIERRKP